MNRDVRWISLKKVEERVREHAPIRARDLWNFFEIKQKYADWIQKQIPMEAFDMNGDCRKIPHAPAASGGRPRMECYLSVGKADRLLISAVTEKRNAIRRFFQRIKSDDDRIRMKELFCRRFPQFGQPGELFDDLVLYSKPLEREQSTDLFGASSAPAPFGADAPVDGALPSFPHVPGEGPVLFGD